MAVFRCKMCGGDLEVREGASVVTCEFCGTGQTIPTIKDENVQSLFNRANVLRMKSEFDKAAEIYEKILQVSEREAEAYWGLILCKYGIEYVEDPSTFKRIPTCHRTSYKAVTADEDYKKAIAYADALQKNIYEAEAKAIEEIQRGILAISQKEEPYDVFICYKETGADGKRTVDSAIANDIYHELTEEGFKVFYAAITLEDKLGAEYEPYIFSALNTAKVMILLGTRPEYFNAVWVKNEWSRFLKIMEKDRSRLLIPCYRDMDAYELPEEFAHLQAQDMSKIGFINDVIRGMKKVIAKEESEPSGETAAVQPAIGNSSMTALLDRGYMALEDGEWENANEYFDQVLNMDARCGEAYLGRALAENKASTIAAFSASRLKQYESGKKEICEACDRGKEEIAHTIQECVVENFLEAKAFKGFFEYELHFESELAGRKNDYETELNYLTQNKLINRTLQFLQGEKKEQFTAEIEEVKAELLQRFEKAKKDHEEKKSSIAASYQKFMEEKTALAVKMSNDAKEERRMRYEEACEKQASASVDSQYELAAKKFDEVGNYQDAVKRAEECRKTAEDIRTAARQAEESLRMTAKRTVARKRRRKWMIAAICCIVIVIVVSVAGKKKLTTVREQLVGETFTGEFVYDRWSGKYESRKFVITFLNEKYCDIEMTLCTKDESGKNEYSYSRKTVTYTVSGGLFGILFNWDSKEIPSSYRDFYILVDGDDIVIETENYLYRCGFTLSN